MSLAAQPDAYIAAQAVQPWWAKLPTLMGGWTGRDGSVRIRWFGLPVTTAASAARAGSILVGGTLADA